MSIPSRIWQSESQSGKPSPIRREVQGTISKIENKDRVRIECECESRSDQVLDAMSSPKVRYQFQFESQPGYEFQVQAQFQRVTKRNNPIAHQQPLKSMSCSSVSPNPPRNPDFTTKQGKRKKEKEKRGKRCGSRLTVRST
jgi:hypothetical protein